MIRILTSGFSNGFTEGFIKELKKYVKAGMKFTFIASEFEKIFDKTDWYCNEFLKMFSQHGIDFSKVSIIDSRIEKEKAKEIVKTTDVVWLSGGDTPTQFGYLKNYDLISVIQEHNGIIIGMSAGSINMCKTAICTLTCEHDKQCIYEGLGLVDFSVEPHLDRDNISEELLEISRNYPLYGICDDGAIICNDSEIKYIGHIVLINNKLVEVISGNEK